ncbi:unnamed protein product [Didymodactylos carnosus]|uniref:Uncharacterized protein n=1 Tax=Didymodactylos carnosus TaxID=1234261 RepID=A0A8S2DSM6_9BILA|nr:unnamed protein product [Didymodactylos carnosus]CAF3792365.1 unnamed protein product [Didymodactylos carnosus]
MLTGIVLVTPGLVHTAYYQQSWMSRRLKLGGWLIGGITLALFPNITLLSSQLQRHLNANQMIITPNDPSVIMLKQMFFDENPKQEFDLLPFNKKMNRVDKFTI